MIHIDLEWNQVRVCEGKKELYMKRKTPIQLCITKNIYDVESKKIEIKTTNVKRYAWSTFCFKRYI